MLENRSLDYKALDLIKGLLAGLILFKYCTLLYKQDYRSNNLRVVIYKALVKTTESQERLYVYKGT